MLTKDKARQIHEDISAALAIVAEKHGLDHSALSSVKYTAGTLKFTTQFAVKGQTGDVAADPKLVANHIRYGYYAGLGEMLGKSFCDTRLGEVTYIGLTSRDKAICKAKDGKMYRFSASTVANMLKPTIKK